MRARITGRFAAVADFELEAFLCDELAPARRTALEGLLASDGALRDYVAERRQAQRDFLDAHPLRLPIAPAAEPVRARRWAQRGSRSRWLLAAALALPAFALGVRWASTQAAPSNAHAFRQPAADEAPDTIRVKGVGIVAELYVKRGERVFRPRAGEPLKPGDRVRLSVQANHAGYLSLLARDEHGAVSIYYDRLPTSAGRFTVPDSLELDASHGDELWLVVVANEPRPADDYARTFAAGAAPAANHVLMTLHKEKP